MSTNNQRAKHPASAHRLRINTALLCVAFIGSAVSAATFTVTTTADSGAGSLRQAVTDANGSAGADIIDFNIPAAECSASGVCTISLTSLLPMLIEAVDIDATTQPRHGTAPANVCATTTAPSYMRVSVEVAGGAALEFNSTTAPGSVRGIAFSGPEDGVYVNTIARTLVQCNHFGLNGEGTVGSSLSTGVGVAGFGFGGNAVVGTDGDGSDDLAERNVFGEVNTGVNVNTGEPSQPNRIAGNLFGLGADGLSLMTMSRGVQMRQDPSTLIGSNLDGVSDALEANVFANAFSAGIVLSLRDGEAVEVAGNKFGINVAGTPAPNFAGIEIAGGTVTLRNNEITMNTIGIDFDDRFSGDVGTLTPESINNCIMGNTTGLSHQGTQILLFAENNFWGAADGPSGVGLGSGDSIVLTGSGTVDFQPWQTSCSGEVFADGFESGDISAWQ